MSLRPVHIVWFKRDLRVSDHAALTFASQAGVVVPLYVIEPELWRQSDASGRQYAFLKECLATLTRDLTALGQPLVVRVGNVTEVLAQLAQTFAIAGLWSHEETGNGWTFKRDKAVSRWCCERGVNWTEIAQNGVVRRLVSRNGWARTWDATMNRALVDRPGVLVPLRDVWCDRVPREREIGIADDPCPGRQRGGRDSGISALDSFLDRRGRDYRFEMSSPLTAARSCSRLSPHLAYGTLSMREVAHATRARFQDLALARGEPDGDAWKKSLTSFTARLHWHCHFIQKLEREPQLEWRNLHRANDRLRPEIADPARLAAWSQGLTGFPFVDACMRSLNATGWLNFRMRAMLVSFASYQLWLPWQATGAHLARQFTDYEPGIHWPQVQMQSGTTGINTVRMYNPVKQGYDQDPHGSFVRRWVPELAELTDDTIHEPWTDITQGTSGAYPARIVDHIEAAKAARTKVWGVRSNSSYRAGAATIQEHHGSRKSGIAFTGQREGPARDRAEKAKRGAKIARKSQLELDL